MKKTIMNPIRFKPLHGKVSKEVFVKSYCKNSGITESEFNEILSVAPCDCNDEICTGWAVSVKKHLQ